MGKKEVASIFKKAKQVLKMGGNIAVVFRNKKLPRKFT